MIHDVTGVSRIRMLYVQLMYRCNFACQHCFHGELLKAPDRYTPSQVAEMLRYFRTHYDLQAVTFLGGEPLLYPAITSVCRDAASHGIGVEICTNGHYGFRSRLRALVPYVSKLRVSVEGLAATNDHIRRPGSFRSATQTLSLARQLGIRVGVTMTVTALNVEEVVPLAQRLEVLGVTELKLHCLRPVGNALRHPELMVADEAQYERLHEALAAAGLTIEIRYDADLAPHPSSAACTEPGGQPIEELERIEVDPRGALTMSCKAVGRHAHAFRWDSSARTIRYEPHDGDEIHQQIPDVVYRPA
ncbi:MAG TPA: radical SAM protein [Streptosporangiaceae bacterium]|jgi:MoaA/NifB/PqqE/SkfB family radical SAM enzyme